MIAAIDVRKSTRDADQRAAAVHLGTFLGHIGGVAA
jgi:hypothetical protein